MKSRQSRVRRVEPARRNRVHLLMDPLEARQLLASFLVTNANNSGDGSLSAAIALSNSTPGPNTINFNIQGTGPFTISPTPGTGLPQISQPVTIDGTSQPGGSPGQHLIEISGVNAGSNAIGLLIASGGGGSTIRGLAIGGFDGLGIEMVSSDRNTIQDNYIGVDASGAGSLPNGVGIVSDDSSFNTIGGADASALNVISGNNREGIKVLNRDTGSSRSNVIQGNFIGTAANGSSALGNGSSGIIFQTTQAFTSGGTDNVILSNVIAGNSGSRVNQTVAGVQLAGARRTRIMGNVIGLNTSGQPVGNQYGVYLNPDAPETMIGGSAAGAGNIISANSNAGVFSQAPGTLVQGNFIGVSLDGRSAQGNGGAGVFLFVGATDATVGGTVAGAMNVISGNDKEGVFLADKGALVRGNYIGTDATGLQPLGNALSGVNVTLNADDAVIGGITPSSRNVISANDRDGVSLDTTRTNSGTLVAGNYIGLDANGTLPLGNRNIGVSIRSKNNTIGGSTAGAGNVISGNGTNGIELDFGATGNRVQGDLIGTDLRGVDTSGSGFYGNRVNGVAILSGATGNTIGGTTPGARVVIAGSQVNGVLIAGSNNLVQGDYIGTDATGQTALGNAGAGVAILPGASGNTIGGTTPGARVVVAANQGNGVSIAGPNNLVQGDYIGTDATGLTALGNAGTGVAVLLGASGNTIGGTTPGARVVVAANQGNGVSIAGPNNLVQGDFIGTDASGLAALGNSGTGVAILSGSMNNTIGGPTPDSRVVIAANQGNGVSIAGPNNVVLGVYIGTDSSGRVAFGNLLNGVTILSGATGNTIGGTTTDSRVVIAANQGNGLAIAGSNNVVQGDFIGTDATGLAALGNSGTGVAILSGSMNNMIGGTTPGSRVVISANQGSGISIASPNNLVQGDYIGTDFLGLGALGNSGTGVAILSGSMKNTIGGTTPEARVVIASNQGNGISIGGPNNLVQGDYIGTDATGTRALGNAGTGVAILFGLSSNTIGGTTPGSRVVISANQGNGVSIAGPNNLVVGNSIGVDKDGHRATGLGNTGQGVNITSGDSNTIGGASDASGNVISGNSGGIAVNQAGFTTIQGNKIGLDATGAPAGNSGVGVLISNSHDTQVGGTSSGARNVISANQAGGVAISGPNNQVIGNYIGVGVDGNGAAGLGNIGQGVNITSGDHNAIGGASDALGNVISGNSGGVSVNQAGFTSIQGNRIGLDAAGHLAGNAGVGVLINSSHDTQVGGSSSGTRNVISANQSGGVAIAGPNNQAVGNYIGVGIDGLGGIGLGNTGQGVNITSGDNNTIGGASDALGNVISGNSGGIAVNQAGFTAIQGNKIGLDASGAAAGNSGIGVLISNSHDTRVGDTTAGAQNDIAFNSTGVFVASGAGNSILNNRIFENGLGIDLSPPGPTINTPGGPHIGANQLLNTPVLIETTTKGGRTAIVGTYNGAPNATFLLQFFADRQYSTGFGQGRTRLGEQSVTTDGSGNAAFTFSAPTVPGQLPFVAATATDASNDTSEFSRAITELSYTVTTTADDGAGSLRQAISNANANPTPGRRRIDFAIPGQGPFTIALASALPAITSPIDLDGYSQPGSRRNTLAIGDDAALEIVLDGDRAGDQVNGLTLNSGGSSIRGLAITRFHGAGILVMDVGGRNEIDGNFIGTDAADHPGLGNLGVGVAIIDSPLNTIGGTTPGLRNVISGNSFDGVNVTGTPATGNLVAGNYIGTDAKGSSPRGNALDGVRVANAGAFNSVVGNVISANRFVGIEISGNSTSTPVKGNLVGTDASGMSLLGNAFGVFLNTAIGNTIGGTSSGDRNVISGNLILGVEVFASAPGGGANAVQGNFIGTSADGRLGLGNGNPAAGFSPFAGDGVFINNAANVTIGGTAPGAGNLISGNLVANVSIFGQANVASVGNVVQGNIIGGFLGTMPSTIAPPSPLPANALGIFQNIGVVINNSSGNTIGGTTPGAGNFIVDNLTGVEVVGIASTDVVQNNVLASNNIGLFLNNAVANAITGNIIRANTSLGVAIVGPLAQGNVFRANSIDLNGTAGVYIEAASNNTIGGTSASDANQILNNGAVKPDRNGVGVYLFGGAFGNKVSRNVIRGNTAYGVFLYNSARNVGDISRSGPNKNQSGGNGIAEFREFTGPVTSPNQAMAASQQTKGRTLGKSAIKATDVGSQVPRGPKLVKARRSR